jgi:hypothetical protein
METPFLRCSGLKKVKFITEFCKIKRLREKKDNQQREIEIEEKEQKYMN